MITISLNHMHDLNIVTWVFSKLSMQPTCNLIWLIVCMTTMGSIEHTDNYCTNFVIWNQDHLLFKQAPQGGK